MRTERDTWRAQGSDTESTLATRHCRIAALSLSSSPFTPTHCCTAVHVSAPLRLLDCIQLCNCLEQPGLKPLAPAQACMQYRVQGACQCKVQGGASEDLLSADN